MKRTNIKSRPAKQLSRPKPEYPAKNYNLAGLAIIILLGIIIYSNSFNCSFHYDDLNNFISNRKLPALSDFKGWWNFNHTRLIPYYSLALNLHLNQFNVWGYHFINLLVHLFNAFLVWWFTRIIFSTPAMKDQPVSNYKNTIAFFTALLFVSHPLATQSVTYIVQRMASMVTMFYLLSLILYLKARLSNRTNTRIILFVLSIVSALFAFMSKENSFTLPLMAVMAEVFLIQGNNIHFRLKDLRIILPIIAIIIIALTIIIKQHSGIFHSIPPQMGNHDTITPKNYLLTQFSVIVLYIRLLFAPVNQMVNYDFPLSESMFNIRTMLSFLFLLALIGYAVYMFRKNRIVSFGIFWFFLAISIESGIIPINDLVFEHRTYLPSIGFSLIISTLVCGYFRDKKLSRAYIIISLLVVCYSFLTFERNKVWKDDMSLWNDNIAKAPRLARLYFARGYAYDNMKQYDKAIVDFSKAIELNPDWSGPYYNRAVTYSKNNQWNKSINDFSKAIKAGSKLNLDSYYYSRGCAFEKTGQWKNAIADFDSALQIYPKYTEAYCERGISYGNLGMIDKALSDFIKAIQSAPDNSKCYMDRGIAYDKLHQWDKAIEDYTSAIKYSPDYADAYFNRAIAYKNNGQQDKELADYTRLLELTPDFGPAYLNRGLIYNKTGKLDQAIADFSKAISINPGIAGAYYYRGLVYLNTGRFDKAVTDLSAALKIDPSSAIVRENLNMAMQKLQPAWKK